MEQKYQSLWQVVKGYFNALPDKENEEETIDQIRSSVAFHGSNLWILVFAILTASLGLNVNSTAVIIGAMLISPLMGPIIGMGMAVGISDPDLLKRSLKNYAISTLISVVTATIYFSLTPLNEAQSELLARTSPTLYDVLIALCGGAAGILALSTKGKGNVIPGVAIATALMPPLCTAGYGIAVGNLSFFLGAFYLFFINSVFIALSTFLGVRMLRFKNKVFVDPKRLTKVKRYIIGLVIITMLPATYMTVQIINQSLIDNNTHKFVRNELAFAGTQIISQSRDEASKTLNVVAVGELIGAGEIRRAQKLMNEYQIGDYKLNVIQGSQSDSLLLLNQELSSVTSNSRARQQKLLEQADHIRTLESQLNEYKRYAELTPKVRQELQALYPSVDNLSLSKVVEVPSDSLSPMKYVLAVINSRDGLSAPERKRIGAWLQTRLASDSLQLVVNRR